MFVLKGFFNALAIVAASFFENKENTLFKPKHLTDSHVLRPRYDLKKI